MSLDPLNLGYEAWNMIHSTTQNRLSKWISSYQFFLEKNLKTYYQIYEFGFGYH